jgi:hypothetical protein
VCHAVFSHDQSVPSTISLAAGACCCMGLIIIIVVSIISVGGRVCFCFIFGTATQFQKIEFSHQHIALVSGAIPFVFALHHAAIINLRKRGMNQSRKLNAHVRNLCFCIQAHTRTLSRKPTRLGSPFASRELWSLPLHLLLCTFMLGCDVTSLCASR